MAGCQPDFADHHVADDQRRLRRLICDDHLVRPARLEGRQIELEIPAVPALDFRIRLRPCHGVADPAAEAEIKVRPHAPDGYDCALLENHVVRENGRELELALIGRLRLRGRHFDPGDCRNADRGKAAETPDDVEQGASP